MKARSAIFVLMAVTLLSMGALGQSVAGPVTFFLDKNTATPSEETIKPLCFVQTGSGSGSTIAVPHGSYFIYRFGAGFGTLTGYGNLRVTSRNGGDAIGTVTADDFDVETQYATGKILLEYEESDTHQFGYLDQVCVDAHWTAPDIATQGIVDLNVTLDPSHPTTAVLQILVR